MGNGERPWRWIWVLGLVAYLAGGVFFLLAPFVHPFTGGIVILACASAQGQGASDDRFIMGSAIAELVIGVLLSLSIHGRPPWAEWPLTILFFVGVLLPFIVITYALVGKPRARR